VIINYNYEHTHMIEEVITTAGKEKRCVTCGQTWGPEIAGFKQVAPWTYESETENEKITFS